MLLIRSYTVAVALLITVSACPRSRASAAEPPITGVAFAPDGRTVITVSQSGLCEYAWPSLTKQRTVTLDAPNWHSVAFSPDTTRLAVGGGYPSEEGIVEVLSWPSMAKQQSVRSGDDSVRSVAWIDDDHLVAASLDHRARLHPVPHTKPDGKPASESDAETIEFRGHSRGVQAVVTLPDHSIVVTAAIDQSLRVWDATTGEVIRNLNQHAGRVNDLALRPDGEVLPLLASAAADRTIRFWQPTIGRMVRYARLDSEPLCLAWIGSGDRVVAGCSDGTVKVVDVATVTVKESHRAFDGWVQSIAVHPSDGSLVAAGTNGALKRIPQEH